MSIKRFEDWISEGKENDWKLVADQLSRPDPSNPNRESSWSNQFKVILETMWEELSERIHTEPSKEEWAKYMSSIFLEAMKEAAIEQKTEEIKDRNE